MSRGSKGRYPRGDRALRDGAAADKWVRGGPPGAEKSLSTSEAAGGRRKKRGRAARCHSKISYGVVLVRTNPATRRPEAVLGKGRYSYAYSEFLHGRYSSRDIPAVTALIDAMSIGEKLDLISLNFEQMWYRIWLTTRKGDLFQRKRAKFQASWLRSDGGGALRELVQNSPVLSRERWEFPKGRRQSNREADILCAAREFEEEAGIQKQDYQFLPGFRRQISYVHLGVRYVVVYYLAVPRRPISPAVSLRTLTQVAEICELQWMDIERIRLVDDPVARRLEKIAAPAFRYVKKYTRGRAGPRGLCLPPGGPVRRR